MLFVCLFRRASSSSAGAMALVGGGAVLARIDAVGKFLNALVGTASIDVARPQQVHAIISAINSLQTMIISDAAAATEKSTTFSFWTAAEKDSMLAAVVAKAGSEASSATGSAQLRRCSQDYSAVHGYLPAKLWLMLCSDPEVTTNKLESLLMHCSNLGMRTPARELCRSSQRFTCSQPMPNRSTAWRHQ